MPAETTVAGILAAFSRRAPLTKAAGWDPVGLQLGDPARDVRRAALCHEVTEAVVEAIERDPVDLLVSYHPLLFGDVPRLVAGATPGGRALRLARADVALAVVHTSFDVAAGGAADALAEALGLDGVERFGPLYGEDSIKLVTFLPPEAADAVVGAAARAGATAVGNYTHCSFRAPGTGSFFAGEGTAPVVGARETLNLEPEVRLEFSAPRAREAAVVAALVAAHPYEEPAYDVYDRRGDASLAGRVGRPASGTTLAGLAERAAASLGPARLRVAGPAARRLTRVAVVPGSGRELLAAAGDAGADAFVSGDLTHHAVRAALERGLCVIDAGHVPTERPGLRRLEAWLGEIAPALVSLLPLDPDPWSGWDARA